MLNQNPHREIKLPELTPTENAKVVSTELSKNMNIDDFWMQLAVFFPVLIFF
jgi:hypothetical protein